VLRRGAGQEGVALEAPVGARVAVPAGVERGIAEQRLEQTQADGDRAGELDHRRRVQRGEGAAQLRDRRPVAGLGVRAWICSAVIAACTWFSPGRRRRIIGVR
jgi:hypothetical protein